MAGKKLAKKALKFSTMVEEKFGIYSSQLVKNALKLSFMMRKPNVLKQKEQKELTGKRFYCKFHFPAFPASIVKKSTRSHYTEKYVFQLFQHKMEKGLISILSSKSGNPVLRHNRVQLGLRKITQD
jgi:hypothetical protein